jgi:hypothetical protein
MFGSASHIPYFSYICFLTMCINLMNGIRLDCTTVRTVCRALDEVVVLGTEQALT